MARITRREWGRQATAGLAVTSMPGSPNAGIEQSTLAPATLRRVQRPSRIHLNVDVKNGDITRVRVGGESVVLGDSMLSIG